MLLNPCYWVDTSIGADQVSPPRTGARFKQQVSNDSKETYQVG